MSFPTAHEDSPAVPSLFKNDGSPVHTKRKLQRKPGQSPNLPVPEAKNTSIGADNGARDRSLAAEKIGNRLSLDGCN